MGKAKFSALGHPSACQSAIVIAASGAPVAPFRGMPHTKAKMWSAKAVLLIFLGRPTLGGQTGISFAPTVALSCFTKSRCARACYPYQQECSPTKHVRVPTSKCSPNVASNGVPSIYMSKRNASCDNAPEIEMLSVLALLNSLYTKQK